MLANSTRNELYQGGPNFEPEYARMKGNQVQHDTMPLYLFSQVYGDVISA